MSYNQKRLNAMKMGGIVPAVASGTMVGICDIALIFLTRFKKANLIIF